MGVRRGGRAVERAGLENRISRKANVGSNPTLSAISQNLKVKLFMADPLQNFSAALKKLQEFCQSSKGSEIEQAGVIQAFKFTFEQCWKSIQKIAGDQGVNIASPKKAFEWGLQNNWISSSEEPMWIKMLEDRNLTTHTYQPVVAQKVYDSIRGKYLQAFEGILAKMQGSK